MCNDIYKDPNIMNLYQAIIVQIESVFKTLV